MSSPYPLLEALVADRDVAVVAKNPKCADLELPGKLVLRFNNDHGRADIWATRLHHGMNSTLHDSCSLVIVPRPGTSLNVAEDLARLDPPITRPIQFESADHHAALKRAIGAQPTTGLLVLGMLSRTSLRSCTLYGFDAHISPDPRVNLKGFAAQHAPVRELRYLRRFLKSDSRFKAGPHCSLVWPEVLWMTLLPLRFIWREIGEVWCFLREHGVRRTLQRFVYVAIRRLKKEQVAKPGHEGRREVEVFED